MSPTFGRLRSRGVIMADMGICNGCGKRHVNRTHRCSECNFKYCTPCKVKLRRCKNCDAVSSLVKPNQ